MPIRSIRSLRPFLAAPFRSARARAVALAVLGAALVAAAAYAALTREPQARDYRVCVTNERSGDLTVIDGRSRKVVGRIPLGKRPRGVHASPDGRLVYVALSGSPISGPPRTGTDAHDVPPASARPDRSADGIGVVDLDRFGIVQVIKAGDDPEEFAVSPDGARLFVSNEDAGTVSVVRAIDGTTDCVVKVGPEPEGVTVTPDGRFAWVACEAQGDVFVIDARSGRLAGRFRVRGRPRSIAFLADGSRAFIPSETTGEVHVVDVARRAVIASIPLPKGSRPMGVAVTRDGRTLWVSNGRGGTVCDVDPRTQRVRRTITVGPRAWGIGLAPDGTTLFVANGPSDDVSVVDLQTKKEGARISTGAGPWGVAMVAAARSAAPFAPASRRTP